MDIFEVLKNLNIKYQKYEHEAEFTNEESEKLDIGKPQENTKNLFLRNKKKTKYFLLTLQHGKKANLKKLEAIVGEKKLSFAGIEDLKRLLGLTPGSVSPSGLRFDKELQVEYYLDADLLQEKIIYFHPDINTGTIGMSLEDFKKLVEFTKHKINIYD